MDLKDIGELASHCIRCGFCLESCPTFVLTGQENASPRGRIYLMRNAHEGKLAWEETADDLAECLGCRACQTACPSGVEYGAMLEMARAKLGSTLPKRLLLKSVTEPSAIRLGALLGLKKPPRWLTGAPGEAEIPTPQRLAGWAPLELPTPKGDVNLLVGCAMKTLFPRVHQATERLLNRVGFRVKPLEGCCGALHAHGGELTEGERRREALLKAEGLIVTNSAGCGSWIKEASPNVRDISEFLLAEGLLDLLPSAPGIEGLRATYHEACHLVHGQGISAGPRQLLAAIPGVQWLELPERDRCCGSAGTYNLEQPAMARQLLERKMDFIEGTQAEVVVMGNPGCHAWIAQGARERGRGLRVLHAAEILEAAFSGLDGLR